MIPTIEEVMKCYKVVALTERMKTGRPGAETVLNALRGAANVCRAAGIELTSPVSAITRQRIDAALAAFMDRGVTRLSAWSYVCQLRGVFAKWCKPYYKDAGWDIPPLELPSFRARAPRYVRPSAELLAKVKNWYKRQTGECWFAATMMLEFAMRNGDVLRLRDENFVAKDSRHFLTYTPHKTELSSGRHVYWPIHEDIWAKFDELGGLSGLDVTDKPSTRSTVNSGTSVFAAARPPTSCGRSASTMSTRNTAQRSPSRFPAMTSRRSPTTTPTPPSPTSARFASSTYCNAVASGMGAFTLPRPLFPALRHSRFQRRHFCERRRLHE